MKITVTAPVMYVTQEESIPSKSGGDPFVKRTLVLDDSHGQYQNILAVEFSGNNLGLVANLTAGQPVTVEGYISSREHQGRYFTSIRGASVAPQSVQQQYQQHGGYVPQGYPQQPQPFGGQVFPQAPVPNYTAPTPGNPPYTPQPQQGSFFQ